MSNPWTRELQPFKDGALDEPALEAMLREQEPQPQRYLIDADLFAPGVLAEDRAAVLACCCIAEKHTFFVVTEHAEEMADGLYGQVDANEILNWLWADPCGDALSEALYGLGSEYMPELFSGWCHGVPPHIWLCPRIRNQAEADERLPHAARLAVAGWHIGIVAEPREHISLQYLLHDCDCGICNDCLGGRTEYLGWLYVAGGSAPLDPAHVRDLRDQCQAAGVPFWFDAPKCELHFGDSWRELPEGVA